MLRKFYRYATLVGALFGTNLSFVSRVIASSTNAVIGALQASKIGQFAIAPVMQPGSFGSGTGGRP